MSVTDILRSGIKIAGCLIGAAAVCTLVYLGVRRIISCASPHDSDDIDGGVVKRYQADVPKETVSDAIVSFNCELSLIAVCDTEELGHGVYTLDAVLSDDAVTVKYQRRDRNGDSVKDGYTAGADFMVKLQAIVKEYALAQHNGYYHTVSGLPDMYGDTIDIVYDSGERIYAHDNQSGFVNLEAARALIELFGALPKQENE